MRGNRDEDSSVEDVDAGLLALLGFLSGLSGGGSCSAVGFFAGFLAAPKREAQQGVLENVNVLVKVSSGGYIHRSQHICNKMSHTQESNTFDSTLRTGVRHFTP